jgi:hypothetical protein
VCITSTQVGRRYNVQSFSFVAVAHHRQFTRGNETDRPLWLFLMLVSIPGLVWLRSRMSPAPRCTKAKVYEPAYLGVMPAKEQDLRCALASV